MKTAGKFDHTAWPALKPRLVAGEAAAWQEAVDLLQQRLGARYLDQATHIMSQAYSGFAVLAIDCAVVEALEQFRQGATESRDVDGRSAVGKFFEAFLTQTRFGLSADLARKFYLTVRNGILHQAETKEDTLVNKSKSSAFTIQASPSGDGVIVNAKRFHEELLLAFEDYKNALLVGQPQALRDKFIDKMDFINRVQPGQAPVVIQVPAPVAKPS